MAKNPFEELERAFERMGRQLGELAPEMTTSTVLVDVADTGDAYVVTADLPGYAREEVDVRVADQTLTVEARHEAEEAEPEADSGPVEISTDEDDEGEDEAETETETETEPKYVRRERFHGALRRSVHLPSPVDPTGAEASLDRGVLTVTVPKHVAEDSGTDIPVN